MVSALYIERTPARFCLLETAGIPCTMRCIKEKSLNYTSCQRKLTSHLNQRRDRDRRHRHPGFASTLLISFIIAVLEIPQDFFSNEMIFGPIDCVQVDIPHTKMDFVIVSVLMDSHAWDTQLMTSCLVGIVILPSCFLAAGVLLHWIHCF